MKNTTLPSALLSVLLLAGLTLVAFPAAAQNLHHGKHESPGKSTACDHNSNCATNTGITVNGNLGGIPSNANPLAAGSGSGYGNLGMGAGPDVPTNGINFNPNDGKAHAGQCSFELGCPDRSEEEKEEINSFAENNCAALGRDRAQGWRTLIGFTGAGLAWVASKTRVPAVIVATPLAIAAGVVTAEIGYAYCQVQGMG